jgi:hypothetical protein
LCLATLQQVSSFLSVTVLPNSALSAENTKQFATDQNPQKAYSGLGLHIKQLNQLICRHLLAAKLKPLFYVLV